MATSGVEAGGDSPGPAEAIVGSGLVALRSDLSEFMGWVVALQGGNEDLPPKDAHMASSLASASVVGLRRVTT